MPGRDQRRYTPIGRGIARHPIAILLLNQLPRGVTLPLPNPIPIIYTNFMDVAAISVI